MLLEWRVYHLAKAIGIDRIKGSIEMSKDADLILLDKDINIMASIVGENSYG